MWFLLKKEMNKENMKKAMKEKKRIFKMNENSGILSRTFQGRRQGSENFAQIFNFCLFLPKFDQNEQF